MGLNLGPLLLLQVDSEAQQGRSLGLTRNSLPELTSTISLQLEQIPSHSEEVIYAESKAQPEFIHDHLNNSHTYEHPHIPSASLPSLFIPDEDSPSSHADFTHPQTIHFCS